MKTKVAGANTQAEELIPPNAKDGSGIGVNYADAIIKSLNTTLEDGRKVSCKRQGLKLTLSVGDAKGEGLMRLFGNGPDVKDILAGALADAAKAAGGTLTVEEDGIYVDF